MSMNIQSVPTHLDELHKQVVEHSSRVELVDNEGGTSVLIAKSELEALEQALAFLSDTDEARAMRLQIARVASASMQNIGG